MDENKRNFIFPPKEHNNAVYEKKYFDLMKEQKHAIKFFGGAQIRWHYFIHIKLLNNSQIH